MGQFFLRINVSNDQVCKWEQGNQTGGMEQQWNLTSFPIRMVDGSDIKFSRSFYLSDVENAQSDFDVVRR